jgi:hypothetical protein
MKTIEQLIEEIIEKTAPLMEVSEVLAQNEAYERGSKLLTAQGRLTNLWKQLADDLVKAKAIEEQAMYSAISVAEGKDADARKASAKANPARQVAAERVALLENNITYVQSFIKQFDAGFRLLTYMVKNDTV